MVSGWFKRITFSAHCISINIVTLWYTWNNHTPQHCVGLVGALSVFSCSQWPCHELVPGSLTLPLIWRWELSQGSSSDPHWLQLTPCPAARFLPRLGPEPVPGRGLGTTVLEYLLSEGPYVHRCSIILRSLEILGSCCRTWKGPGKVAWCYHFWSSLFHHRYFLWQQVWSATYILGFAFFFFFFNK